MTSRSSAPATTSAATRAAARRRRAVPEPVDRGDERAAVDGPHDARGRR
jgi:hypothetical protein